MDDAVELSFYKRWIFIPATGYSDTYHSMYDLRILVRSAFIFSSRKVPGSIGH